jgi:hypothetical protein
MNRDYKKVAFISSIGLSLANITLFLNYGLLNLSSAGILSVFIGIQLMILFGVLLIRIIDGTFKKLNTEINKSEERILENFKIHQKSFLQENQNFKEELSLKFSEQKELIVRSNSNTEKIQIENSILHNTVNSISNEIFEVKNNSNDLKALFQNFSHKTDTDRAEIAKKLFEIDKNQNLMQINSQNLFELIQKLLFAYRIEQHQNFKKIFSNTSAIELEIKEITDDLKKADDKLEKLFEAIEFHKKQLIEFNNENVDLINRTVIEINESFDENHKKLNRTEENLLKELSILETKTRELFDNIEIKSLEIHKEIRLDYTKILNSNLIVHQKIHKLNSLQRNEQIMWKDQYSLLSKQNLDIKKELVQLIVNKSNLIHGSQKYELKTAYDRIDALFSIYKILDIIHPLPIMNEWAISSDFAHHLLKTIMSKESGNIIDIGSGISTIISGYALKKRGHGKVISLEHDEIYYNQTFEIIKQHQLDSYVELHYCPLTKYNINGQEWLWYDIDNINFNGTISIITVDGPPGNTQEMSRYPAIPILEKHINSNTTILLDDGDREDEKKIAEKWRKEHNLKCNYVKLHKGLFVCNI